MITVIKKGSNRKDIEKAFSKIKGKKKFNAYKYCGAIKLKENPVEIQKRMRNEWS